MTFADVTAVGAAGLASLGAAVDDTQQNAARVEETAAVAQSLRSQVESLLDAVGMFTLGNDSSRGSNPPQSVHSLRPSGTELQRAA